MKIHKILKNFLNPRKSIIKKHIMQFTEQQNYSINKTLLEKI